MNLQAVHSVYMIGIGGIGMSALARYFRQQGMAVYGYDRTETALTKALQQEGIEISFSDEPNQTLPEAFHQAGPDRLVVYTPAIPEGHHGMQFLRTVGHRLYKRSEVLGLISRSTRTVGVAGTHGKTTTSSMIAHVLHHAGVNCNAFLGGIATNFDSNLVLSDQAELTVVEADEFDRSFLTLYPHLAVVTSMDADHLDIYGDHNAMHAAFNDYVKQLDADGVLICNARVSTHLNWSGRRVTYALEAEADYCAINVRVVDHRFVFDCAMPDTTWHNIELGQPGLHNIENALATIVVAREAGLSELQAKAALSAFKGVKRRFEYQVESEALVYIDDYAHHPAELDAMISSVKELYPGRKITGVFQPHLYTRTRDFADGFARSLAQLHELWLLDIYPARELPIVGVTSAMLLDKVELEAKLLVSKKEVIENVAERKLEVLLTLGAGDIDQLVQPIKDKLEARVAATK